MRVSLRRIGRYGLFGVLIVLSTAITFFNFACFRFQYIHTSTKIALTRALMSLSDVSGYRNMLKSPVPLEPCATPPDETTELQADGFSITIPFDLTLEKANEIHHCYTTPEGLIVGLAQSLPDEDAYMLGQTYYEFTLSALQTMPRDFLLARGPLSLYHTYMLLGRKAMINSQYYVTNDDVFAYTDQLNDTLLVIHACNPSTLIETPIAFSSRDTDRKLTEDEIAYILHHIEPAPRWEVTND